MSDAKRLRGQAQLVSEAMRSFAEATADFSQLLNIIARTMATSVEAFCAIALPNAAGTQLDMTEMHDVDAVALPKLKRVMASAPVDLASPHFAVKVFQTGEAATFAKFDDAFLTMRFKDPDDLAIARSLQPRAQLVVALRVRGESVGLLSLLRHGADARALDEDDLRLAQTLADHAALAIANSKLISALAASESRWRQIVETAHEGIWITDGERRTTFANRRLLEILKVAPDQIIGKFSHEFVAPEERERAASGSLRRKQGVAEHVEMKMRRTDGVVIDTAISASPLFSATGTFLGTVGLVTDITEKKAMEVQLRQAQKMEAIGRLAGGVAHDFNNMLSVILSCTQLAMDELTEDHRARSDLNEVLKAGERSRDLTKQILAFSRKQILKPKVFNANEALRDLEPMMRRLIGEDLHLTLSLSPELGAIKADPGQLEQVLMNLAINARDAMPRGGRLTLETSNVVLDETYAQAHLETTPGPHVMIAVSDTGVGMDKETQAQIFEPFFTTKGPGQGTGLGLATVFGIVKQSGGSIWLYSEPGRGTTFKIYFPRTDEPLTVKHAPIKKKRAQGTETILLVEDEPMLRNLVASILRRAGYQVLVAAQPSEALTLASTHAGNIELLFTDVVMPEMTGKELAEKIVATRPTIRVLFMSGYTENTVVHHGVLDEGIAFLPKPITPDAVLEKVRQTLS